MPDKHLLRCFSLLTLTVEPVQLRTDCSMRSPHIGGRCMRSAALCSRRAGRPCMLDCLPLSLVQVPCVTHFNAVLLQVIHCQNGRGFGKVCTVVCSCAAWNQASCFCLCPSSCKAAWSPSCAVLHHSRHASGIFRSDKGHRPRWHGAQGFRGASTLQPTTTPRRGGRPAQARPWLPPSISFLLLRLAAW